MVDLIRTLVVLDLVVIAALAVILSLLIVVQGAYRRVVARAARPALVAPPRAVPSHR